MSENTGAAPIAASSAPAENSGAQVDNSTSTDSLQAGENNSSNQIDAIENAVASGDITPKEAQKMIEKFELKIRGQKVEREYDLSDKEFLKNQFQLAEVAKMSQQEKAEQEKLFQQLLSNGAKDPMAFIKEAFGLDPDELAALHIEKKIAHLKKSPEVLEKEQAQEELRIAREEAKKLKEEKETAEMSKLQQEALAGLHTEISGAIKAHTKLPDTKYVQKKMAEAMWWAENNGYPGTTAEDVAPLVEHEMRQEMNELYDMMPEDVLESYFGRKNIDRLRKSKIAKAKEVPSVNGIKSTSSSNNKPEPVKQESQKIDAKKFWRGR